MQLIARHSCRRPLRNAQRCLRPKLINKNVLTILFGRHKKFYIHTLWHASFFCLRRDLSHLYSRPNTKICNLLLIAFVSNCSFLHCLFQRNSIHFFHMHRHTSYGSTRERPSERASEHAMIYDDKQMTIICNINSIITILVLSFVPARLWTRSHT